MIKEPFEDKEVIAVSSDVKCDICGDNKRHMIFDFYHSNNDEDLCVNCYVNRYGIDSLVKGYGKTIPYG